MGERSAEKLIAAVDRSRKTTLVRFLYALGIPEVGDATSRLLASNFGSLEKLAAASVEELQAVSDIGPVTAAGIAAFFRQQDNLAIIVQLREAGVCWDDLPAPERSKQPLRGQSFVLSGTLAGMSRDEAKAEIESLGGKVSSSVSSRTTYLVCGENPGSKLARATSLGVQLLDEPALLALLR